jgi:hypothetical protein
MRRSEISDPSRCLRKIPRFVCLIPAHTPVKYELFGPNSASINNRYSNRAPRPRAIKAVYGQYRCPKNVRGFYAIDFICFACVFSDWLRWCWPPHGRGDVWPR